VRIIIKRIVRCNRKHILKNMFPVFLAKKTSLANASEVNILFYFFIINDAFHALPSIINFIEFNNG
jgi:hypothetical protein